jgi:hypothetical protein
MVRIERGHILDLKVGMGRGSLTSLLLYFQTRIHFFALPIPSDSIIQRFRELLKEEFRNAKEEFHLETIKQILRHVIPEDTTLLSKAVLSDSDLEVERRKSSFTPRKLSEGIIHLREFCIENGIESSRAISLDAVIDR